MKVGVGGTFNVLHRGHKVLLDKAFEVGDEVLIGLTSDAFASSTRREVQIYDERRSAVESYLANKTKPWSIKMIDDFSGNITEDRTIGALIVSPMTYDTAKLINQKRSELGLFPFKLVKIDEVLADDCTPISATRIINGEIDAEGKMLRAMLISVGSENGHKIEAVRTCFRKVVREDRGRRHEGPFDRR